MKKTPELPSGGGRFIRGRDGSLKKAEEDTGKSTSAPAGKSGAEPAQPNDKKEG